MHSIANKLVKHLKKEIKPNKNTAYDYHPNALADILKTLGEEIGDDWLKRRALAYQANHANDPQSWPPPTAIDWLWIDMGDPLKDNEWPLIAVPPFSLAPGESQTKEKISSDVEKNEKSTSN